MISEVEGQYKEQDVEKQIREFWQSTDAYNKVRAQREDGKKFYFVDGPPYTTGNIHMGTAWNKVIKDSILRYRSMNGFHVKDTPGWDMHGLPIEVKVEESFGFKNKKDIEEYGVAKFIDRCKEFALRQKDDMTNQFKALGAWMDWKDPYMTLKNEYIEAAWWALKRANERGLLEKGLRVVNWCPRCETAIADAEVEYWDETDSSIYVKFPIEGETNTYIVIWTTTPWTIPANVGVAVNQTFEYSKVQAMKGDGHVDILIMASDLVESVLREGRYKDYEVVGKLSAEEMKELRYRHPLVDLVPRQSRIQHGVYTADFVTAENTGCVHIAPGHGLEDFELGMDNQMDVFCPVGENGRYTGEAGEKYEGKYVKEADGEIILDLTERGLLLASGKITHRYGHCWRCKTPIIYIATSQWFLKISDLRPQMLDEVAKVTWYPGWAGSARFSDWISGARDWCISRQRYWGIPLPIWTCNACGNMEVIGTQAELEGKSGVKVPDLHRPEVDNVLIDCPCGGKMKRSPDVFDVWFDSAVASWATLHFPRVKEGFEDWWPADFITEGHDQTRGWFYSQLGASMVSFGRAPYKSVLMHGFTLDEQGRKMSKSIGNVVSPGEVIDKFGADTLRLYVLGANAPWEDLHFSWEAVENVHRVLNIFWNAYRFPLPYMVLDNFDASKADLSKYKDSLRSEDRWILSGVNSLVEEVNKSMESYELQRIVRAINVFILEDLSRWYIQLVRPRTWIEQDDPDKLAAYATIYEVMVTLCKVTAPFIPFLSEMIYQNLVRGLNPSAAESVHMCDWPRVRQDLIDKKLEKNMALVREISEAASNARQKAGRKLRWPVSEIIVAPAAGTEVNVEGLLNVLKSQTNSKIITVLAPGDKPLMNLEAIPVPKAIGPAFKGDAGKVIGALKGVIPAEAAEIKRQLDASGKALAKGFEITGDMVTFKETPPENLSSANFSQGTIYVNTSLTPELEAEGYSREVIRRIQDMRKEMDLNVEDRIKVGVSVDRENVLKLLQGLKDYIANEVRASRLDMGRDVAVQGKLVKDWTIEEIKVKIGVETA